jgi:hypothetical protein
MTLKIERLSDKRGSRIRLSGELRSEHLDQVKVEIERGGPVVLDLEEVDLVDIEGVRFLNTCEAKGIPVLHSSPYIREWMSRGTSRKKATYRPGVKVMAEPRIPGETDLHGSSSAVNGIRCV